MLVPPQWIYRTTTPRLGAFGATLQILALAQVMWDPDTAPDRFPGSVLELHRHPEVATPVVPGPDESQFCPSENELIRLQSFQSQVTKYNKSRYHSSNH